MKNLFKLCCCLLLLNVSWQEVQAQNEGQFRFSIIGERLQNSEQIAQSYGINLEYYISDWWSIGYQFSLGSVIDGNRRPYGHFTLGSLAASFPFRAYIETEEDFYLYITLLALILPETINFHIRASDNFHISPYISPFGVDYYLTKDNRDSYEVSFSTGLRFDFIYADQISISPFVGVRGPYKRTEWNVLAGAMIGISF